MSDRTVWRLRELSDEQGVRWHRLKVHVTVDTESPTVLRAIERAAAANGILLERVDEPARRPSHYSGRKPEARTPDATGSPEKGTAARLGDVPGDNVDAALRFRAERPEKGTAA